MSAVMEKESTDLVEIPPKDTALQAFTAEKGLDPYLQTIRQELDKFLSSPPALDTAKGRQAYASMAHKIARSKTAIDNLGKELVAELKEKPKKVDAERKRWRDQLDAWRDEARGPLNEWEAAEDARIARHQSGIEMFSFSAVIDAGQESMSAVMLRAVIETVEAQAINESWEEFEAEAHRAKSSALATLNKALDARVKHEAEQAELDRLRQESAERAQKEREEQIARDAADNARRQAEQAAQAERDAVEKRETDARINFERKVQEAKDAAHRLEQDHQEAMEKAQRDAVEERQRIQAEHKRVEDARLAEEQRNQQEILRRQADKDHKGAVNRLALEAMIKGGMPEDCAKQAITLIAKSQIPNITINY
jgi:DNA repair exonuclease SbcCD ATPase subunit